MIKHKTNNNNKMFFDVYEEAKFTQFMGEINNLHLRIKLQEYFSGRHYGFDDTYYSLLRMLHRTPYKEIHNLYLKQQIDSDPQLMLMYLFDKDYHLHVNEKKLYIFYNNICFENRDSLLRRVQTEFEQHTIL
jgi:hypothetical protein